MEALFKRRPLFGQFPFDLIVPSFVVGAGVDDHGAIRIAIERDRAFGGTVQSRGAIGRGFGSRELTKLSSLIEHGSLPRCPVRTRHRWLAGAY